MLMAYQNGSTLAEIGREFGLSPQRVHQILLLLGGTMRSVGPRPR